MKKAVVYQRGENIYLHALSRTTAGVWVLSGPVFVLDLAEIFSIVDIFHSVISGSFDQVPHPVSWKGIFDPVLQKVGVKSLSAFMKNCKCVEVEVCAEEVVFVPTKNLGPSGGFQCLDSKVGPVLLSDSGGIAKELGKALSYAM